MELWLLLGMQVPAEARRFAEFKPVASTEVCTTYYVKLCCGVHTEYTAGN